MRTRKTKGGGKEGSTIEKSKSNRINELKFVNSPLGQQREIQYASAVFEEANESVVKIKSIIDDKIKMMRIQPITSNTDMGILRMSSLRPDLRVKDEQGTTSCRHFVILIISEIVANELYSFIYEAVEEIKEDKRVLLSRIWRQTLEQSGALYPELKDFFSHNHTRWVDRFVISDIGGLTATGSVILLRPDIIPDGVLLDDVPVPPVWSFHFHPGQIYPMAITTPDGSHVLHYFCIKIERGRPVIYSAYGSDYLRAHPARVEITSELLNLFIRSGIDLQTPPPNPQHAAAIVTLNRLFRRFFTNNADGTVRYLDEILTPAKYVFKTKEEGIKLEIQFYIHGYCVMYFPTVTEGLRAACRAEVETIKGQGYDNQKRERVKVAWSLPMRGGNKKRSNRRITRRKITRRRLRRYTRPKN